MATRLHLADLLLLCEPDRSAPPRSPSAESPAPTHDPLAPSSAPDAMAHGPARLAADPPHPSAAPACQRAAPLDVSEPAEPTLTRPIWPPVPRSGVAPLRSPQSLPYSPLSRVEAGIAFAHAPLPRVESTSGASVRLSRNLLRLPPDAYYVKSEAWIGETLTLPHPSRFQRQESNHITRLNTMSSRLSDPRDASVARIGHYSNAPLAFLVPTKLDDLPLAA